MITKTLTAGGKLRPITIRSVSTWQELGEFGVWIQARRDQLLGLDCETNAEYQTSEDFVLRSVQIADLETTWVIQVNAETRPGIPTLIRDHPQFVAHWAEMDEGFLARGFPENCPVRFFDLGPHFIDTQPMLGMYDPRTVTTRKNKDPRIPRKAGLKDTTARLLGPELQDIETAMHAIFKEIAPKGHKAAAASRKYGFANIDLNDPVFQEYAGRDPMHTLYLYYLMKLDLERRGQWRRCLATLKEQWMMDCACQAEEAGMAANPDYSQWLEDQLTLSINKQAVVLAKHDIKPSGMGLAVGEAFRALGHQRASYDKKNLTEIQATAEGAALELIEALTLARKGNKFRSTYSDPMRRTVEMYDGVMRASVRALGTVTTRMSARGTESAGPIQQLPKKDPRIRAAAQARPGCVFVTADFSQGEPFTMAALSGDKQFLADLMASDINSTLAAMTYGEAFDPAYGKTPGHLSYLMRQNGKAGWLAACYGCAIPKLAETLSMNMPPELRVGIPEASAIMDRWRDRYPDLWGLSDRLNQMAAITLDSGHRIPLWDRVYVTEDGRLIVGQRPSRLGLNAASQGTQSDLLRVAMHRFWARGWGWALRMCMHDEMVIEVPAWMAEEARRVLEECMTVTYRGVTVRCEAVIEGESWMPRPSEYSDDWLSLVDE